MEWIFVGLEPRFGRDFDDWSDIIQLETGFLLRRNIQLWFKKDFVLQKKTEKYDELIFPRGKYGIVVDIDSWKPEVSKFKGSTRCFYPSYQEPVISMSLDGYYKRLDDGKIESIQENSPSDTGFTLTEIEEHCFVGWNT